MADRHDCLSAVCLQNKSSGNMWRKGVCRGEGETFVTCAQPDKGGGTEII